MSAYKGPERTGDKITENISAQDTDICPKALSDVYSLRQSIVQTTINLVKA